jgi:hypothetical protein
MAIFGPGMVLPAGGLSIPGEMPGTDILVGPVLAELPIGQHHEARVGSTLVQLTVIDPGIALVPELRARLVHTVERMQRVKHATVLRLHGHVDTHGTVIVVREFPRGPSVRRWIHDHLARAQRPDPTTVVDLVDQLTMGAAEVQRACVEPVLAHGFIGADTAFVVGDGEAALGGAGEGGIVPLAPSFGRYLSSGLLPMIAPEIVSHPSRWVPQTDVYGLATLAVEMLVGRVVDRPNPELEAFGVPRPLLALLTAATRGALERRPRDLQAFRDGLAEARAQLAPSIARPRALTPPPPARARMLTPPGPGSAPGAPGGGPPPPPRPTGTPPPLPARGAAGPRAAGSGGPAGTGGAKGATSGARGSGGSVATGDLAALERATARLLAASGGPDVEGATEAVEATLASARPVAAPPRRGPSPAAPADASLAALEMAAAKIARAEGGVEFALGTIDGAVTEVARVTAAGTTRREVSTAADPRASRPRRDEFLVRRNGVDQGPYDLAELRELARAGNLFSTDRLWSDDHSVLAVDVPELRTVFEDRMAREAAAARALAEVAARKQAAAGSGRALRSTGTIVLVVVIVAVFVALAILLAPEGASASRARENSPTTPTTPPITLTR